MHIAQILMKINVADAHFETTQSIIHYTATSEHCEIQKYK